MEAIKHKTIHQYLSKDSQPNTPSSPALVIGTPSSSNPLEYIDMDSLISEIDSISSKLENRHNQIFNFNKQIPIPIGDDNITIPTGYICPISYKPIPIESTKLSVFYDPSKKVKKQNNNNYSDVLQEIITRKKESENQGKSQISNLNINQSDSDMDISDTSNTINYHKKNSNNNSMNKNIQSNLLINLTNKKWISTLLLKKLKRIFSLPYSSIIDSKDLCILLSDIHYERSNILQDYSIINDIIPNYNIKLNENEKNSYFDLLIEQSSCNFDMFDCGNLSNGLFSSLSMLYCLIDRLKSGNPLHSISKSLKKIIEPVSNEMNYFIDPLDNSNRNQSHLRIHTLLKVNQIIKKSFNIDGPQYCNNDFLKSNINNNSNNDFLDIPFLLGGFKGSWIELKPTESMNYWEKTKLQPYIARKNFNYLAICPVFPNDIAYTRQNLSKYMKELSSMFEICNLGNHRPVVNLSKYPQGVIPVFMEERTPENESKSSAIERQLLKFKEACEYLRNTLGNVKFFADGCLVIYIINPFPFYTSQLYITKFQSIFHSILPLSSQNVVFQNIPLKYIVSIPECGLSIYLKDLAFSVFNKCRRISYNTANNELAYQLYEPLFILSPKQHQQQQQHNFSMSSSSSSQSIQSTSLHIAYGRSLSGDLLIIIITDSKGELLEYRRKSIHKNSQSYSDPNIVWEYCKELLKYIPSMVSYSNLFIGKFGSLTSFEVQTWKEIANLNQDYPLVIFSLNFQENIQLLNKRKFIFFFKKKRIFINIFF